MWQARSALDFALYFYDKLDMPLTSLAKLVHSSMFESAVIKIQDFHKKDLSTKNKRDVWPLLIERAVEVEADIPSDGSVQRALKCLYTTTTTKRSDYMDTGYLISRFNCCKRLFSVTGHALSNCRRRILPITFESQMFLYMDGRYSGIDDVKMIVSDKSNPKSSKD